MLEAYPREPMDVVSPDGHYELAVRSQAGAEERLRELGALEEIEQAVLAHCEEHRPAPPYKPQLIKDRLEPLGWRREVRVPPYDPALDDKLTINERYDIFKFFQTPSREIGVAVEMEGWEIQNDLLKFRRGFERGQIEIGVLLQPFYYDMYYCFEHMRYLNEPLFGHIPVLFCCPRGPGLKEPARVRRVRYGDFLMPGKPPLSA
jgi:hypothetical protein